MIKRLALTAIVLSGIVLAVTAVTASPDRITWERSYDKAIERAQAEKKLIIADMFTDWCVLCKQMDQETFAEPGLIERMADKYVWLKLNTETEEDGMQLQRDFGISTYPTILVLDAGGEEVDRIQRFLPAEEFRETVESLVDSPDSLAGLRKQVEQQPDSVSARYALGEKFLNQNNYLKAAFEFRKVAELDPENLEGKTDLSQYRTAICLFSELRFNEAIAQLDLLETRFPGSGSMADAAVLKGEIYHCCGKLNEAQAILQEYVKKYPTHGQIQKAKEMLARIKAARS